MTDAPAAAPGHVWLGIRAFDRVAVFYSAHVAFLALDRAAVDGRHAG